MAVEPDALQPSIAAGGCLVCVLVASAGGLVGAKPAAQFVLEHFACCITGQGVNDLDGPGVFVAC